MIMEIPMIPPIQPTPQETFSNITGTMAFITGGMMLACGIPMAVYAYLQKSWAKDLFLSGISLTTTGVLILLIGAYIYT